MQGKPKCQTLLVRSRPASRSRPAVCVCDDTAATFAAQDKALRVREVITTLSQERESIQNTEEEHQDITARAPPHLRPRRQSPPPLLRPDKHCDTDRSH